MLELNDVINQMDLADLPITFHPNTKEYNFSAPHGIFSKTDHILDKSQQIQENCNNCSYPVNHKLKLNIQRKMGGGQGPFKGEPSGCAQEVFLVTNS